MKRILGQEKAISLLKRYITTSAVPPSFLFLGPEGVGRKTTAIEFAKTINCEAPMSVSSAEPCDICRSCQMIDAGTYPYLMVVDLNWQNRFLEKALAEISIDTVREIQRSLSMKTLFGKKRFVVVDSAEKLSKEAANSFLKTLEEPPEDTTIILISNSRKQLLPTIVSRCQIVNFTPLSDDVLVQKIKQAYQNIDEKKMKFFLDIADGSIERVFVFLSRWDEFLSLKNDFDLLELKNFKDVEINDFLNFLVAFYKKEFVADPDKYLKVWSAIYEAKIQNALGVNKNMLLTQLHSRLKGFNYAISC